MSSSIQEIINNVEIVLQKQVKSFSCANLDKHIVIKFETSTIINGLQERQIYAIAEVEQVVKTFFGYEMVLILSELEG